MNRVIFLFFSLLLLSSCTAAQDRSKTELLYEYAHANCLFWYFDSKGYDSSDIRGISGGIVETSDVPLEKFQQIALFVRDFSPNVHSKNNIDPKLLRCFQLDKSPGLSDIINR